jgi:uncharacterized protein (UPF0262 family)
VGNDPGEEVKLVEVVLDQSAGVRKGPDVEHERRVAIFDLIEENYFAPKDGTGGPYRLRLSRSEGRLIFDVEDEFGTPQCSAPLPLATLRRTLRDYEAICDSYHEAIKTAPRSRIEAIDMGRRAFHNEGSEALRRALADKIDVDEATARRLFTLIFALHVRL